MPKRNFFHCSTSTLISHQCLIRWFLLQISLKYVVIRFPIFEDLARSSLPHQTSQNHTPCSILMALRDATQGMFPGLGVRGFVSRFLSPGFCLPVSVSRFCRDFLCLAYGYTCVVNQYAYRLRASNIYTRSNSLVAIVFKFEKMKFFQDLPIQITTKL